jgi:stage III sporulation protein AB
MTGACGFGVSLCRDMDSDIKNLKIQKQMLLYIKGEISYIHRPMEEIFDILSEKFDAPYGTMLGSISDKMRERTGRSLQNIWLCEISDMNLGNEMSRICVSYLEKMSGCFGCEGGEIQVDTLELLEKEIECEISQLTEKKTQNSRLIRVLSTLAGVLCIILFL